METLDDNMGIKWVWESAKENVEISAMASLDLRTEAADAMD